MIQDLTIGLERSVTPAGGVKGSAGTEGQLMSYAATFMRTCQVRRLLNGSVC